MFPSMYSLYFHFLFLLFCFFSCHPDNYTSFVSINVFMGSPFFFTLFFPFCHPAIYPTRPMFLYSTGASGNKHMQTQTHAHMTHDTNIQIQHLPNSYANTLFLGLNTFMRNNAKGGRNMVFQD